MSDQVYGVSMDNWAHKLWSVMHAVSFTFPLNPTNEDVEAYRSFYESLARTIPCRICGAHFGQIIQEHPVDTRSMTQLSKWVVDAHNIVNKKLHKQEMSYQSVVELYLPPSMRTLITPTEMPQAPLPLPHAHQSLRLWPKETNH